MEKLKVIAILDRSTGNDAVGEMWHETKIFEMSDTLQKVMVWAALKTRTDVDLFRSNLKLTIAQ